MVITEAWVGDSRCLDWHYDVEMNIGMENSPLVELIRVTH